MPSWEDTLPEPGQRVMVDFEPGCPGEQHAHAIWPLLQGKKGTIARWTREYRGPYDHDIWVRLDEPISPTLPEHFCEWFKLTELRPLDD